MGSKLSWEGTVTSVQPRILCLPKTRSWLGCVFGTDNRDSIYGDVVRNRIEALGMEEVISAKQSPWQNPYSERVIGSIRRECTDHLIPLDASHLRTILGDYVEYYNTARCHQSLDGNAPEPRPVHDGDGTVYAIPHLGGLHHEYRRAG